MTATRYASHVHTVGQVSKLRTRHFGCSYYLTWFFKCYECKDNGWWLIRTPDDRPLYYGDAFLFRAMEIIQTTMNLMRKEEMGKKGLK